MDSTYKQLIVADQEQNRERATNLPILDDSAKKNIAEACKYSSYFPNPITTPFMRRYILSKMEFPTKESELAQSMTELNVRIENLYSDALSFSKAQIEVEKFQLKLERAEQKISLAENDLDRREAELELKEASLDLTAKQNSLKKIELTAMARYKEMMGWKQCVEDIMQEAGYKSLDEVDWDNIRMGEMQGKIKLWGELHAQGALEMTPSKLQAIYSSPESFGDGLHTGFEKIKQLEEQNKKMALIGAAPRSS